MVRYPYTLEYLNETEAVQLLDGSWVEGLQEWVRATGCNVHQNGSARTITAQDGVVYTYNYEIVMPAEVADIPIGTLIRVFDKDGHMVIESARVKGFFRRGQRYAHAKLWV